MAAESMEAYMTNTVDNQKSMSPLSIHEVEKASGSSFRQNRSYSEYNNEAANTYRATINSERQGIHSAR